uniref:Putative secreted protein n=1 Tax=Ixodes ricinus TaxID=34613 RepID=A0A6B0UQ43_IXORI
MLAKIILALSLQASVSQTCPWEISNDDCAALSSANSKIKENPQTAISCPALGSMWLCLDDQGVLLRILSEGQVLSDLPAQYRRQLFSSGGELRVELRLVSRFLHPLLLSVQSYLQSDFLEEGIR